VQSEPVSQAMQCGPNGDFRKSIFAAYSRHQPAAPLGTQSIRHRTTSIECLRPITRRGRVRQREG
jgi:hypothetical protein